MREDLYLYNLAERWNYIVAFKIFKVGNKTGFENNQVLRIFLVQ